MITTSASPIPCWYLSHVGMTDPRLPVASAFQPVLGTLGRRFPFWLAAAVTGDVLRANRLLSGDLLDVPCGDVVAIASDFGLQTTTVRGGVDEDCAIWRDRITETIAEGRAGLIRVQDETEPGWFPLIGHTERCEQVALRSWGQQRHEYRLYSLGDLARDPGVAVCFFEPLDAVPPTPFLARRALQRSVSLRQDWDESTETAPWLEYESWARQVEGLSEEDAANPVVMGRVTATFVMLRNSKRCARDFCRRALFWLPAEATRIEQALQHYERLAVLLDGPSRDFGDARLAGRALLRAEKRSALAMTCRAAGRIEARAFPYLRDAASQVLSGAGTDP